MEEEGKEMDLSKITKEKFTSLEKEANDGDAKAQNDLGDCYYFGWGTKKDLKKAEECYEEAAKRRYNFAINNLKYLGDCYRCGLGTKRDLKKAAELYLSAGSQGNYIAVKKLEIIYDKIFLSKDMRNIIETEVLKFNENNLTCYIFFEPLVNKVRKIITRRQKILDCKNFLLNLLPKSEYRKLINKTIGSKSKKSSNNLKTPLLEGYNADENHDNNICPSPKSVGNGKNQGMF